MPWWSKVVTIARRALRDKVSIGQQEGDREGHLMWFSSGYRMRESASQPGNRLTMLRERCSRSHVAVAVTAVVAGLPIVMVGMTVETAAASGGG